MAAGKKRRLLTVKHRFALILGFEEQLEAQKTIVSQRSCAGVDIHSVPNKFHRATQYTISFRSRERSEVVC